MAPYSVSYPHVLLAPAQEVNGELQPLTAEQAGYLTAIPGVRFNSKGFLRVPNNALESFSIVLGQEGLTVDPSYFEEKGQLAGNEDWDSVKARLHKNKEVYAEYIDGFGAEYQKKAITFGANRKTALLEMPTGSGKTYCAILLLCASPKNNTALIVTRAPARIQYARSVRRFTNLEPYIFRPIEEDWEQKVSKADFEIEKIDAELTKAKTEKKRQTLILRRESWEIKKKKWEKKSEESESLGSYIARMKAANKRPVFIVGWESLSAYEDKMRVVRPKTLIIDESHQGKKGKCWDKQPVPIDENISKEDKEALIAKWDKFAKENNGFVVDKGTHLSVHTEKKHRATTIRAIREEYAEYVYSTTATLVKNRSEDVYGQFDLLEPGAWGSKSEFRWRYCDPQKNKYGFYEYKGQSNVEELVRRRDSIVYIVPASESHKDLPPKIRESYYIDITDLRVKTTEEEEYIRWAKTQGSGRFREANLQVLAARKIDALLDMVVEEAESGKKSILFTGRKQDAEEWGRALDKRGVKNWVVHGEKGGGKLEWRQAQVDDYMSYKTGGCVFVATGDSCGESLDLQDTDVINMVMLPPTPGQVAQWEGRGWRHGMTRSVLIRYCVVENSPETSHIENLASKFGSVNDIAGDQELANAREVILGIENKEKIQAGIESKIMATSHLFEASDDDWEEIDYG